MKREITINYKGVELDIEYWYQPYEAPERGLEAQYPGCGEHVEEISQILHKGENITELLEDQIEDIEEAILKELHNESTI